ncbi:long-chain fatty acid-CoA ligase [Chytriomyces hyalinus]|nr:long-chain fatty acid-CoA ligase [Chytriomyces hyalinus]
MAPRSVIVPNSETPGAGPIHRNALSPEKLAIRPQDNFNSVYDVLLNGVQRWPNKPTLGARHVVNIIEEEKEVVKKIPGGGETTEIKKWKYFELSGFEWQTWNEVFELCKAYGSGLRSLGLENGGKITFYADTSRDWMTMALAASTQSFTVTTAYATLGEDGLIYSLDECEITTIYTTYDLLPMISKVASKVKTLKNVVYSGKADAAHLEKLKNESSHLAVLSLEELKTLGEQTPFDAVPPKTEDLALIMYTSGSTGPPKGVMITHSNIVAGLAGANTFLLPYVSKARDEVYLAYLPLAHILEYIVEMAMLAAFLYAGIVARIVIWHLTFCINSFAHWIGDQEFSTESTARGTFLLAVLTQGEGYHNFHHEFPKDYRNGIHPLDWDPTKWLIYLAARIGLASNLYTYPENEINKARVTTMEALAREARKKLDWGPSVDTLPILSWNVESISQSVGHDVWIGLDGFVLDVRAFRSEHPGGQKVVDIYLRKNATKAFYGVLNNHSKSARSMVEMLRVAKIEGGEASLLKKED